MVLWARRSHKRMDTIYKKKMKWAVGKNLERKFGSGPGGWVPRGWRWAGRRGFCEWVVTGLRLKRQEWSTGRIIKITYFILKIFLFVKRCYIDVCVCVWVCVYKPLHKHGAQRTTCSTQLALSFYTVVLGLKLRSSDLAASTFTTGPSWLSSF